MYTSQTVETLCKDVVCEFHPTLSALETVWMHGGRFERFEAGGSGGKNRERRREK